MGERDKTRRNFLKTVGIGAAALAAPQRLQAAAASAAKDNPGAQGKLNVLFLFTDDQREDTVSALGNPHIKTPNLDKLVENGFLFTSAYCMGGFSGAVCLPSRMMTLRGRNWFAVRGMRKDAPNFPKSMNQAGYVTYHHGKRGNTDRHVHKSFTYSHYLADHKVRLSGYPGKEVADDAIKFLRSWRRAGRKGPDNGDKPKPFFMYLAFGGPHDPRVAAKKYLNMYDANKIPAPDNFLRYHPFNNGELVIRDERLAPWPRTKKVIREHLRDYYAVITCMDEHIGQIIEALRKMGEYENTIIIFSSDQGIAIGSHGLMGKQNLYEHSMGVPLVFCGPGIPKGKSSDAFAYLFDVYPTVCDLVGARIPKSVEGKSLAPIIRGRAKTVRDTIFLAYRHVQRAVRRGKWKLIRYPQVNRTQLFDLEADPHETNDLAGRADHAETVKKLMTAMAGQQKLFGDKQPLTSKDPEAGEVDLRYYRKAAAEPRRPRRKKKRTKPKS